MTAFGFPYLELVLSAEIGYRAECSSFHEYAALIDLAIGANG